jgi:Uncharacterised nucleotidyltransferase
MNRARLVTNFQTTDVGPSKSTRDIELPRFAPELALLVACSRWPFSASQEQEIRIHAAAPIDWDRFQAWVRRNRIAPLVYRNLRQAACPLVPEAVVLQLHNESTRNAQRSLMQIAEAVRVTRILAAAGIRSMIVKGPTLAQLAFGDLTLRESQDVDLVIDSARLPEVDRMVVEAGYRRVVPAIEFAPALYDVYRRRRCQFGYYSETRDLFLELHWRLTSNPLLMPMDATLWNRSEKVRVAGASLSTLPDEDLFLYLCIHGSVHMWFRLKWLVDISALLQRLPPEVIDRIARRAKALGVYRSFNQAMILAHGLMGAPVPSEILADACRDRTARQLAIAGCRALDWRGSPEEPIKSPWFSAWVNWHAFQLKPGLRFRWRELQNQIFSPEDCSRVRLPEQLFFLYPPLRLLSWVTRHCHRLVSQVVDVLRRYSIFRFAE